MKLKEVIAKLLAEDSDLEWIAVDANDQIYGYYNEPHIVANFKVWRVDGDSVSLGKYTGVKNWKDTLASVSGRKHYGKSNES